PPEIYDMFCSHYTPAPGIYPLSLHDALPISALHRERTRRGARDPARRAEGDHWRAARQCGGSSVCGRAVSRRLSTLNSESELPEDRKSTRLNSSHVKISYAVSCLKKKTWISI